MANAATGKSAILNSTRLRTRKGRLSVMLVSSLTPTSVRTHE
jgi:hypothetical protein